MTLVLDAGAFMAVERGDRDVAALIVRERRRGRAPVTHGGVIGQIWRGGSGRQANVARLVAGCDVRPLDDALGKRAGLLLADAGGRDVIDAALVLLAVDGDEILTSDPDDLESLAAAAAVYVELVAV